MLLAVGTSAHAILYKRDSRAAVGWVGLIWLVPIVGPVLYVMFGINRIRRHATTVRAGGPRLSGRTPVVTTAEDALTELLPPSADHLGALGRLVDRVTRRPLTLGNAVTPLVNGDEAYPAMLAAIAEANESLVLCTYIFDNDPVGREFADALVAARGRGVEVRILIDGLGSRYSWPPMVPELAKRGLRVARFMPTIAPWRAPFFNLRNHRKILVADGRIGFAGGINIRVGHVLERAPKRPVQDLHFRFEGPVARHLMEAFAEDWAFTTHEMLEGPRWFPDLAPAGPVAARGITDGPDEDFEKLRWTLLGALGTAERSVRIATPYFLPDGALATALDVAALRDVHVELLLPAVNNQPLVHWAQQATLWQVLKRGVEVYLVPPPFDHSKLLIVDDAWTLVGSANWDPRSLRLNFELNVECYDPAFAGRMNAHFEARRTVARRLTARELDERKLPVRLRDGVARLLTPYL